MKKYVIKNLGRLFGTSLGMMAVMVATLSANTTCTFIAHQSELPESAKKLRKF